jgi:hypothetical protein
MTYMTTDIVERAADFVWRHGRLVERRRLEHELYGAPGAAVAAAVGGYRNADGGYGHALEPDCRTPASQPEATRFALELLDRYGATSTADVRATADWLASVSTTEGGVPFCLPTVAGYPRAPWWEPEGDPPPANINPTAGLVGLLRKAGLEHPWVDGAEAFCWNVIESRDALNQYEAHNVADLVFALDETDRVRAARKWVLDQLASGSVIPLEPGASGDQPSDVHTPLQYAPEPGHPCRAAFTDVTIDAFLDHLAGQQQDDGGWPIDWPAPGDTAVFEWRAIRTVDALATLRAYGRVGAP